MTKIVMNFKQLTDTLLATHKELYQNSIKAINIGLTIRNWLFGFYIVEFEQNGEDRAIYGEKHLHELAQKLKIRGLSETNLKLCRQFYKVYPSILVELPHKYSDFMKNEIGQSVTDQLYWPNNMIVTKSQLPTDESCISNSSYLSKLLNSISFTHFTELIKIEDEVKRKFYELLIVKTQPSVAELKRQIHSLAFERLGLSGQKDMAFEQLQNKIIPIQSIDLIKSHYFFDFLNLPHPQLVEESELEQALINHLQEFIIELGNGFCFEARQKRILIDDEYYFIDLVFYHRILKCHVLIELKTQQAKHEHIGQLKAYLQHYKQKVMESVDNPPVGILLVTDKKKTLVEYAIADSDKEIFVSKYQFQLPDKKELELFINQEIANL